MSDAPPASWRTSLELDELVSRIERQQEKTRKFVAEPHKLMVETSKFNRDWWIVPLTAFGAVLAAIVARLPELLYAFPIGAS